MSSPGGPSKALATWLALVGGGLGLHRFYLHGAGDRWAWLHLPPTLVGAWGFWRLRTLGSDDALGAMLVPLLGAMLAATMLVAIVTGLTPAERWRARFPGSSAANARTGWAVVVGVGSVRRAATVRWGIAGGIVWAWILTIPASAVVAAAFYKVSLWLLG